MSEVTTEQRVTFEVVEQQNHVRELLDLPVSSETPGLDALLDTQAWKEKAEGKFETGVTPLWYATQALGLYENPVFDEGDAAYLVSQYRRHEHRWRLDRRRAVKEISHRFYSGRMSRVDARNALLEWELECVFTPSGVLVSIELIPQQQFGRCSATCMPSRALHASPRTINSSPARFRGGESWYISVRGSQGIRGQSALHNEDTTGLPVRP